MTEFTLIVLALSSGQHGVLEKKVLDILKGSFETYTLHTRVSDVEQKKSSAY